MRSTTPTFDKAAEIVIEMRAGTWRNPLTVDVWRSSFRRLVSPVIGGNRSPTLPVPICCPCLRRSGMMGGRRRRGGCGIGSARWMRWSIGAGHRTDNPAGEAISEVLPKNGTAMRRHRRALHHRDVAGALAKIRASKRVGSNQAAVGVHDFDRDAIRRGPAGDLERGGSPGRGLDGPGRENEGRS